MTYSIRIRRSAEKTLKKIPEPYQSKIIDAIQSLSENPFPQQTKKLTGREAWRLRIGDYRIIYEILDQELIIMILNIAHRKDIYRKK